MTEPRLYPLVFLASPFRAKSFFEMLQNVRSAEYYAAEIAIHQGFPFSPVLNSYFLYGAVREETVAYHYKRILRVCDILCQAGTTEGILEEVKNAQEFHIPVYTMNTIQAGIKKWREEDASTNIG